MKNSVSIYRKWHSTPADNVIDIAGFTRLTEKTIWQAIENSGVDYKDWTACREGKEQPVLHIYLELNKNYQGIDEITNSIHQKLAELDTDYANLEALLNMKPIHVTILPRGSFHDYSGKQQALGSDLGKLRPPHINPSKQVLMSLTNHDKPDMAPVTPQEEFEKVTK